MATEEVKMKKITGWYGVWAKDRDVLIGTLHNIASQRPPESGDKPLVEGHMLPCGHKFVTQTLADVPLESWPCTCGDPRHWFVKYGDDIAEEIKPNLLKALLTLPFRARKVGWRMAWLPVSVAWDRRRWN